MGEKFTLYISEDNTWNDETAMEHECDSFEELLLGWVSERLSRCPTNTWYYIPGNDEQQRNTQDRVDAFISPDVSLQPGVREAINRKVRELNVTFEEPPESFAEAVEEAALYFADVSRRVSAGEVKCKLDMAEVVLRLRSAVDMVSAAIIKE